MTTLPLDDAGIDDRRVDDSFVDELADEIASVAAPDRTGAGVVILPWWRPLGRWKAAGHRVLPGVSFPIALFAFWRLAELGVSSWLGGNIARTPMYYDGEHYLRILHRGYFNPRWIMPVHAFFPAISWLAWPAWWVTRSDEFAVHLVANVTAVTAFICVWGVSKAWLDERLARRAVLLFALFPSSLFLWTFYSEGLFITLGAGAVWADRRGRRGLATALLLGIGATRSVGVLIPAVIILARIIHSRRVDRWCVAYAVAGMAGLVAVLIVMQQQVGDAFAFLKVQKDWGRSISAPWTTVIQGYHNLWPRRGTVMIPALVARNFDLWCVAIVVVAVVYAIVTRGDRFPMETWMLGVAMIVLPLCSGVLASFNRFLFADWIIYPVAASALDRLPRPWRLAAMSAIAISLVLTGYAMIGRFSVDRFVG